MRTPLVEMDGDEMTPPSHRSQASSPSANTANASPAKRADTSPSSPSSISSSSPYSSARATSTTSSCDRTRGVTAHAQPPPQRREDTFLAAAVRRMTRRTSLFSPPAPLNAPSHDDATSRALAAPLPRIPRRAQMFSKIPATCRNSVDKAPAKTYNHIAFSARRPKCCYGSVGRAHPW